MDSDTQLDRDVAGPRWLSQPALARMVTEALHYGETARRWYRLHAWVVMPNHVHVIMTPQHTFSEIMRWLKWTTARRCNQFLGRTGVPFWQDESYDHWIRSGDEMQRIVGYVERNPVAAGLVKYAEDWIWSSANEQESHGDRQATRSPAHHKCRNYFLRA